MLQIAHKLFRVRILEIVDIAKSVATELGVPIAEIMTVNGDQDISVFLKWAEISGLAVKEVQIDNQFLERDTTFEFGYVVLSTGECPHQTAVINLDEKTWVQIDSIGTEANVIDALDLVEMINDPELHVFSLATADRTETKDWLQTFELSREGNSIDERNFHPVLINY